MLARKPVALIILDGFALHDEIEGNAVAQARKPNFDDYWATYPHTTLTAAGEAVGLPDGQMGNSEVGHLNIGAGRIVYQDLTRITKSIRDGDFYTNPALLGAVNHAKHAGKKLHICGLLSDGGVHSHNEHLYALLRLAKQQGLDQVYLHMFMDGRDVPPSSGLNYMKQLLDKSSEIGIGRIASIHGRYYAMDRDKRWERVTKSYHTMTAYPSGDLRRAEDPIAVIEQSYQAEIWDEFIEPTVIIDERGLPVGKVESGDAVIFTNFRPDRAIQLSEALTQPEFKGFVRGSASPESLHFVCMTTYSDSVHGEVAFGPKELPNTFGDVIAQNGLKQLRTAETEKYPHVTFFFNGGRHEELIGESRVLIHSPKVATYDLKPEMSAYELARTTVEQIHNGEFDAIVLNFANPDMVGHSGKLKPTIQAVEATDECLGQVVEAILDKGGTAVITADHGNADIITLPDGSSHTAHTTNPVPFIVTDTRIELREGGILADIAPTLLELLQLEQPAEMTGKSLIRNGIRKE